ncbi:phage head spike fiber domain-containing protein [Aeromonas veronii]|uniref:phage head spike fiber domain-containing protein n=1 Tax=Aeromonas veronii TaxID=654 RepID=UPI003F743AA1
MAGVWKRDGTVVVTNGSKKVTGTGTTFADAKNGVAKGHLFCMTTGTTVDLYEVDYVVSNTELHLVQAFRGTTGTGKAYEIITTFSDSIPEFARKLNASLSYYQGQSDMVQQLFTSDAAEITVTAPDGTTHKLIPWKRVTSEGEGQASRAKVEADRSRDEANRSKDEADRVAGMVALAALPLPDVWAPLSDSLRLITGYGRDVKVGEDVVASYVTLSRSTPAAYMDKNGYPQLAQINAPRFEREGLRISGQSTNLNINGSAFLNWFSADALISATQEIVLGRPVFRVNFDSASSDSRIESNVDVNVTGAITHSVLVRGARGRTIATSVQVVGRDLITVIHTLTGEWQQLPVTAQGVTPGRVYFHIRGTGAADSALSVDVAVHQLENLPYATPPIPTDGAAATRAADTVSLPQSLNLGESQLGFSLAVEFDSVNQGAYRVISLSDYSAVMGDGANIYIRHAGREIGPIPVQPGKRTRLAYTVDLTGVITACINGEQITAQSRNAGAPGSNEKIMFGNHINTALNLALEGHLRDLKIWTKTPLTADQLKVASA